MCKKKCKVVQIITDGVADEYYKGNRVLATGTVEQLEVYKKQLIENGHTEEFKIESREISGRNASVRIQGYELVEHAGKLYPKRNILMAYKAAVKQSQKLLAALESLNELKSEVSEKDALKINKTMVIVREKIDRIAASQFNIPMI